MRLNELLVAVFTAATSLSLFAGYASQEMWVPATIFAGIGFAWWALGRRFGSVIIPLGMFLFTVGAVVGIFSGVKFYLVLVSFTAALGAWDLFRFRQRLSRVEASSETAALEARHALKLVSVLVLGATLSLVASELEARFSFWAVTAIAIVLLFVFEKVLRVLRKSRRVP